jgi:AraC family ethanolamine operon transcriptional activator
MTREVVSDWPCGTLRASCLEEYEQVFQQVWNLEYEQLAGGLLNSKIDFLGAPGALIYRERLDRPISIRGELDDGQIAFALPGRQGYSFQLDGRVIQDRTVPWLAAGGELDVLTRSRCDNLVLVFKTDFLRSIAEKLRHPLSALPLHSSSASSFPADPEKAVALRRELEKLLAGVEKRSPGRAARETRASRLDERLAETLLDALDLEKDVSEMAEGFTEQQGYLLVRQAMNHARSRRYDVTIAELCGVIGRSRRTLERLFREVMDVSPSQYLMLCRMHEVRRDLMMARFGQARVTDFALRWGFDQLGRFAGTYRQLFGELPSETLRRFPQPMEIIPRTHYRPL